MGAAGICQRSNDVQVDDENDVKEKQHMLPKTGHDPAVHGAKLEDRNYNNEAFKKRSIDPSDNQQNNAALAIQTQFRQKAAKDEVQGMREEVAATRIQAGFRGYMDREALRDMKSDGQPEEEVDIDLNDPDVEQAAIKIQAGFKGFKARKEIQDKAEDGQQVEESQAKEATEESQPPTEEPKQEEEIDIDLNDPETEKAAQKIQAGFRGYQTRKDLKETRQTVEEKQEEGEAAPVVEAQAEETTTGVEAEGQEEIDIDLNDPEVEEAAKKIQAGFKGMKARKEVAERKSSTTEESTTEAAPAGDADQPAQDANNDVPAADGQAEEQVEAPAESQPEVPQETQEQALEPETEGKDEVDAVPAPTEEEDAPTAPTAEGEGDANGGDPVDSGMAAPEQTTSEETPAADAADEEPKAEAAD